MSRRVILLAAATVAAIVAVAALFFFVIAPSGADSAEAAVLEHVDERADDGTAKVLAQQDHGDGQLVLVGYERRGVDRLGLAFAAEAFRGWQVSSYTEEAVEPDDVQVGSLLVASSEGGDGQPAWSAAVGQLIDTRIDRVEIRWSSGDSTIAAAVNESYLVVERGTSTPLEARYLAEDGTEIAKVPIEETES